MSVSVACVCATDDKTYLSAESSGSLLAASLPCAIGSVDVVEACDPALDAEVLVVVHGELLRSELLQTVGVLRLRDSI